MMINKYILLGKNVVILKMISKNMLILKPEKITNPNIQTI